MSTCLPPVWALLEGEVVGEGEQVGETGEDSVSPDWMDVDMNYREKLWMWMCGVKFWLLFFIILGEAYKVGLDFVGIQYVVYCFSWAWLGDQEGQPGLAFCARIAKLCIQII